jgi:TP901 family phage tail tape measure protein
MNDQKLKISISADDKASPEVKKLKGELEALGKIKSFAELKSRTAEALREWRDAQARVKELGVAMKAGGDDAGKLGRAFEAAKKEAAQLKTAYTQNRESLQNLRNSLTGAGVDIKNLSAEQKRLRESTLKAKEVLAAQANLNVRPYKDVQAEIGRLRASYDTLRKSGMLSSADLLQAQLRLKEKTAELRRETGDWTGAIGKARAGLITLAGAGYALIKSFQSYSEFSQRMGEVNTLIDVSREQFNGLSNEIRKLTKDIPQSASELAAAEYDILSAGVGLEKSTRVLELSAKAAVAGVTDTKTAANTGISVINAYGKSIDELDDVYDLLFQTVKSGVTTFPQLAQSIGDVLPTARAADVGFKDVAAAIATMTKAGIRTPQATTALKGAINALAAPAPEARKQFDALGLTWEGLIPTLDAIRKKGLSIDQLRMLIPDVEARTGILALVQNFDSLNGVLGEMDKAAGATEAAYNKMAETPANQLKLLRNEIDDLAISAGALIATGLLPLAKIIRSFVDAVREADPVTQTLVGTLAVAAGGFAIWKLGLGSIVLGLRGMILQATTAQAAAGGLAAQFTAAGIAMKAGLAAAAIYGAIQIGLAVKALYDWGKAANTAKKAQEDMSDSTDRTMKKLEGFKDIKLPGDITKLAQQDLEDLRRNLIRAQGYYTALKFSLQEKAKETTFLGTSTDQARAAQKELVGVTARLREIQTDLKTVGEAATGTGVNMEKPAKAVMATSEQLDAFEKQAKKSYANAVKEAEKYAQQVIAWEEKIKYARLSTEDKVRELGRKGLSEELAWNDTRLQADQKLYAAKEALKNGDFELAEKLAKDAEGLYADLAEEVKGADKGDAVVKGIEETKQVAIAGVTAVGDFINQLYTQQKDNAAASRDKWTETANAINEKLNEIARQREANVQIELKGLEAAQSAIAALVKPATKVVTIVQKTVQASQAGGPVGFATGGKLPGYGGGDRIRALLEAGEFVIRKEAVKKYGASLFAALNSMRLDLGDQVKARIGGMISGLTLPAMPTMSLAFQAGGQVPVAGVSKETMTIRFQAGGVEMPIVAQGAPNMTRAMVKQFERELIRLGMARR